MKQIIKELKHFLDTLSKDFVKEGSVYRYQYRAPKHDLYRYKTTIMQSDLRIKFNPTSVEIEFEDAEYRRPTKYSLVLSEPWKLQAILASLARLSVSRHGTATKDLSVRALATYIRILYMVDQFDMLVTTSRVMATGKHPVVIQGDDPGSIEVHIADFDELVKVRFFIQSQRRLGVKVTLPSRDHLRLYVGTSMPRVLLAKSFLELIQLSAARRGVVLTTNK